MAETHDCNGNKMLETSPNVFSYKASPTGEGKWMDHVFFTIQNCVVQTITLKRDCPHCPITSPFGVLTNNSEATSVMTHDSAIVWDLPPLSDDQKCSIKKLHSGVGVIGQLQNGDLTLIDEPNQLEFHYVNKTVSFCNHTFYPLKNIDGGYIQLPQMQNKTFVHFYNQNSNKCLSHPYIKQTICADSPEQHFIVPPNLVIQHSTAAAEFCFYFVDSSFARLTCDRPDSKIVYNPITYQITNGTACLAAAHNSSVEIVECSSNPSQQWLPEVPHHQLSTTEEESQPLLAQHHQFVEDKSISYINTLEHEIKQLYCGNLQVRRYTTLMLAESNGIQAAMANNLPLCHRLKPNGDHLIVQRCVRKNITVEASLTRCGYEPRFENFTIGRDGYSLHPFQSCFWKDRFVNLNGISYSWNNMTRAWQKETPTYHLSAIKLTEKFAALSDNEFTYRAIHHPAFEATEYEQLNVINELVARIRDENADSMSSLVMNKHSESKFWKLSKWSDSLFNAFVAAAAIIALLTLLCVAIKCVQICNDRRKLTQFAVQLHQQRLRPPNLAETAI